MQVLSVQLDKLVRLVLLDKLVQPVPLARRVPA